MKAVLFSFALTLVTLGSIHCDEFSDQVDDLIQKCYSEFYYNNKPCRDLHGTESCLEAVLKQHPDNKGQLDDRINFIKSEKNICPELVNNGTCPNQELYQCTKDVGNNYQPKCELVNEALSCIVTLNKTCETENSVRSYNELYDLQRKCDAGLYGDGPCKEEIFYNCTLPFYSQFSYDKDWNVVYECDETVILSLTECLDDIGVTCADEVHKELVKEQLDNVRRLCSPVAGNST